MGQTTTRTKSGTSKKAPDFGSKKNYAKKRSTSKKTTASAPKSREPLSIRGIVAASAATTRPTEDTAKETPMSDAAQVPEGEAADTNTDLRKRDLIEAVVARSGVKKRDAKPAIEAALAVLGEALAEGRMLNLPPFGKVKVVRTKELDHAQVLMARIRQRKESEKE